MLTTTTFKTVEIKDFTNSPGAIVLGYQRLLPDSHVVVINANSDKHEVVELKTRVDSNSPYTSCTIPNPALVAKTAIFFAECNQNFRQIWYGVEQ